MKKNIPIIILAIIIIAMMTLSLTGVIDEKVGMCISLFLMIIFTLIVAGTAHKNEVRIIEVVMIVFMIASTVLLAINIYSLIKSDDSVEEKFFITINPKKGDRKQLFTHDNIPYFGYNVDEVIYVDAKTKKKVSLESALNDKTLSLNDLLSNAIADEGTVGYKLYYYGGGSEHTNDQYSIIVCGETEKVVFSTYDYSYSESICD